MGPKIKSMNLQKSVNLFIRRMRKHPIRNLGAGENWSVSRASHPEESRRVEMYGAPCMRAHGEPPPQSHAHTQERGTLQVLKWEGA